MGRCYVTSRPPGKFISVHSSSQQPQSGLQPLLYSPQTLTADHLLSVTVSLFQHLTSSFSVTEFKQLISLRSDKMALTALTLLLLLLPGSTRGDEPGVVQVVVQEDSDAILPCSPSTKENLELKAFNWIKENDIQRDVFLYQSGVTSTGAEKFRGRVSYFTDELKNGNASIIIINATIEDSGNYICVFPQLVPEERFHVELVVGASPKPYFNQVNFRGNRLHLQCVVRGAFPKPEVEFQDSAGNVLPAEEPKVLESGQRYTVTLSTTLTKTDRFRCVSKQKEIHHETFAEINVGVGEKNGKVDNRGSLVAVFLGVFSLAAVLA